MKGKRLDQRLFELGLAEDVYKRQGRAGRGRGGERGMSAQEALTVSQLNAYIKSLVDRDDFLGSVAVRGELSNYKICLLYTSRCV